MRFGSGLLLRTVWHGLQNIHTGSELDLVNHVPFQNQQQRGPLLFVVSVT